MNVAIPTAATIDAIRPSENADRSDWIRGVIASPTEARTKHAAPAGDIRPGPDSLTVMYDHPRKSSIPVSTLKISSTTVRRPTTLTTAAHATTSQRGLPTVTMSKA